MEQETLNWINLADKFAREGDPKGMRACARELWNIDAGSMDGPAIMAEAAMYMGDYEESHALVYEILQKKPAHHTWGSTSQWTHAEFAAIPARLILAMNADRVTS